MISTDGTPLPPPAETPAERQRRKGRERFARWYEKHKGDLSVRPNARSNAPQNDKTRREAVRTLHEMGIDPGEVVTLNEIERKVKGLEDGQSELRQRFEHLQKALRGSGGHQWTVGDWVLCPAPIVQGRNRKAVSTQLMVVAYGEITTINHARREATVQVAPGQCVTAKLDDMILRRPPSPTK